MTVEPKTAYHHGNLKRVLMDEALKQIGASGVDSVSMRSLAREAGVSHQAPYSHFADRTDLLHALAHEGMALMDESMAAGEEAAGPDPGKRLAAIGKAYVTFAVEHPDYYAAMNLPEFSDPTCHPDPDPDQANTWERMQRAVVDCQAAGELPAGDVVVYGVYLWSLVHGLASLWTEGPLRYMPQGSEGIEPMADAVLGACMESLASAATKEGPR
jgi:AcrR family transcriptional regulator